MTSDERRHDEAESEPCQPAEDDRTGERAYDSFVVRLWREVGARRLLRVEVEHVQSGGTATARGMALGWIGAQIAAFLGESRAPPDHLAAEGTSPPDERADETARHARLPADGR